jgi:UPF0755 protein
VTEWFTGETPRPAPSGRQAERERQRAAATKRRRRIVTAGVTLTALAGVAAATVLVVLPFIDDLRGDPTEVVSDYPGPGIGSTEVVVYSGDGGAAIAETLVDAGVVATASAFIDAYSLNPDAQSIQPGTYKLPKEMRAADALAALLNADNRQVVKYTIPEGFRVDQVYARIAEATGLTVDALAAAASDTEAIGLPAEAEGDVEGWLFPATYEVDPEATPVQVLAPMVAKTVEVLETLGAEPASWRQTLILASMIEKEAKLDEDRPKVARVFLNRIKEGILLQSDATVSYGVGNFSSVFTTDEERAADNPYNTYLNPGLPGGAICNPGEASITAALGPAEGDWLYFVVINLESGETAYAEDAAGHEANVLEMQQWIAEHPGDY